MEMSEQDIGKAFQKFDEDDNKTISFQDLSAAFRELGLYPTRTQLTYMLELCDKDESGTFSLDEFEMLIVGTASTLCNEKELKVALQIFNNFDKYDDEFITKDQFKEVLVKSMGKRLSGEEIDEMIAAVGTDKNGNVTFEGFKKLMRAQ